MICDFVARTNRSNIKSNYFVNTVIIFNLSYYTNVIFTVTFVNQPTLCRAFIFFLPQNYQHKYHAIFHIDHYILNIHTEVPDSTNKLNHMKRSAVFQNKPFAFGGSGMNHLCHYWDKCMLTIVWVTFFNRCAQWLPLVDERFCINKSVAISIVFFKLGVTNNAEKPNCVLPIGDNGFLNRRHSSSELIVKINKAQLSCKQQLCQNANTRNHTLISCTQLLRKILMFFLEKQLASKGMFLVRSKHSFTLFFFCFS